MQELGLEGPFPGGKHPFMHRNNVTVIIPNPHQGDVHVKRLIRMAGITREEWLGE